MGEVAIIELPRGDPGAVSDAGAALARVAGGFEMAGGTVGRAVSAVGSWQGRASVAFQDTAASYQQAAAAVEGTLAQARGALRRYEAELDDAREAVRRLRREEEACVERLALERRLEDAEGRAGAARDRLAPTALGAGVGDPFSLAEQAGAQRDLDQAGGDARRAEVAIDREREELARLRREAVRERERAEDAEDSAAAAVRQAAGELPDVRLPTGEVSPPALTGTPFDPFTRSDFDRRLDAAPEGEGVEPEGDRLKVPDPGESLADRLFGRDYVFPEEAGGVVLEGGGGNALGRLLGLGPGKAGPPRVRLTPGGGLKAHEGAGRGHTIARHVGLSDDALRDRLKSTNPSRASSFPDRATAEDAVSGAITANKNLVDAFLRSGNKKLEIDQEFNRAVGRTIGVGDEAAASTNKARIVLVKDGSPLGYHVKTAFPIP